MRANICLPNYYGLTLRTRLLLTRSTYISMPERRLQRPHESR